MLCDATIPGRPGKYTKNVVYREVFANQDIDAPAQPSEPMDGDVTDVSL